MVYRMRRYTPSMISVQITRFRLKTHSRLFKPDVSSKENLIQICFIVLYYNRIKWKCHTIYWKYKCLYDIWQLGWTDITNPCGYCWAVWVRPCPWIVRADRQPATARTRPFSPPQTSSSETTWGRGWLGETFKSVDSHQWSSCQPASSDLSSWTAGSGNGQLHQLVKQRRKKLVHFLFSVFSL